MGENSDGSERNSQKNIKITDQFSPKFRSFSVGAAGLSKQQINKIIGISDNGETKDKKTGKSDNANKVNNNTERNLQGTFDKFDKNLTRDITNNAAKDSQEERFGGPDDVFKPRKSVARTPPISRQISIDEDTGKNEMSNKRPRSDTTPEFGKNTKRQCDEKNYSSQQIEDTMTNETEIRNTQIKTENIILDVFSALDQIQNTSSKEHESECCQKTDQNSLRSSVATIYKCVTLLVHRLGVLENDKIRLEHTLHSQNQSALTQNDKEEHIPKKSNDIPTKQRTYAVAAQSQPNTSNYTAETTTPEQWKTPRTVKKLETLIRMDQITDPKETVRQLKKEIATKDIDGGFRSIRQLKDGAIVVESCNEAQQEKLKLALQKRSDIKVKDSETTDPMFTVTGIEKGHPGKECQASQWTCPNCTKMRYKPEDSQHSSRDINCPVYKKRLQ